MLCDLPPPSDMSFVCLRSGIAEPIRDDGQVDKQGIGNKPAQKTEVDQEMDDLFQWYRAQRSQSYHTRHEMRTEPPANLGSGGK